ncbi:MAG: hypothetical protein IK041_01035 [Bacteroidales bacterium]|nr:hypothetical protein [Bacteroidales bacterium]
MKRAKVFKYSVWAILVVIIAVLLLTCPGRKAHREALIDAVGNSLVTKANLNLLGDAAKSFKAVNYDFYNNAVNPCLKVMGYGLFSIGYIPEEQEEPQKRITWKRVSFGILGHVFVKDKENIYRRFPLLAEPKPVV